MISNELAIFINSNLDKRYVEMSTLFIETKAKRFFLHTSLLSNESWQELMNARAFVTR